MTALRHPPRGVYAAGLGFLILVTAGGCIGAQSEPCGDQVCPRGSVCTDVAGRKRCLLSWQTTACRGLADGDICDNGDAVGYHCEAGVCVRGECGDGVADSVEECDDGAANADGIPDACRTDCRRARCGDGVVDPTNHEACDDGPGNDDQIPDACRGNCSPPRCGDGITDPSNNELCDDGNFVSGDGCSADCFSEETCGNGYTDTARGETCDDGNLGSRDGCSSGCTIEQAAWRFVSGAGPTGRSQHAMVYDSARQRVLLYGGVDNLTIFDQTWILRGARWSQLDAGPSAGAHDRVGLAYDAARDRVVLLGGNDTWEFDGSSWQQRQPATTPTNTWGNVLTYDASRGRTVFVQSGRTWEWDGVDWQEQTTSAAPTSDRWHAMTYDAARALVVLFGGNDTSSGELRETWEYDGTDWTQRFPATPPSGGHIYPPAMAYDAVRQRTVVFGVSGTRDETWEWDGADWTEILPTSNPSNRSNPAMAFDAATGQMVLFGGDAFGSTFFRQTWTWDGVDWSQIGGGSSPLANRHRFALAYDQRRAVTVMFGGGVGGTYHNETWEWDGLAWQEATPAVSPSIRRETVMVYDPSRGVIVLHGGIGSTGQTLADTWLYDGTTWTEHTAGPSPGSRREHAMAFLPAMDAVILFGGSPDGNSRRGDTWAFDGVGWEQLSLPSEPSARKGHAMAYHAGLQAVLLFGGDGVSGTLGDTWVLDATGWTELAPAVSPSPRAGEVLVAHLDRGTVILNHEDDEDAWEFTGSTWRALATAARPVLGLAGIYPQLAYDRRRGVVVAVGDGPGFSSPRGTWLFGFSGDWPAEVCTNTSDDDGDGLVDCADPDCAGEPRCYSCGDGSCGAEEWCGTCPGDCGSCTGCGAADIQLAEVYAGPPSYLELTNSGTCAWDAAGLTVRFRLGCDAGIQSFTIPVDRIVPAGGTLRVVESRDASLTGEISSGAEVCHSATGSGWVMLCEGPCDLTGCSNVTDYLEIQGPSGPPTSPPACATFSPAPVDVSAALGSESVTRLSFSRGGAVGAQGDWGIATYSRD